MDYLNDPILIKELKGVNNTVLSARFSSNNKNLVTGGLEYALTYHMLEKPLHNYKLFGHEDVVYSVDYFSNADTTQPDFIVSASRDKTVRLWKIDDHLNRHCNCTVYRCHSKTVRFVNVCSDGSSFCTASDDKSVKVWSSSVPNKRLNTFTGHTNWVKCCKFCKTNYNLIASCGDDSSLRLFDLRINGSKGACLKTLTATKNRHFTYLDWFPKLDYFIAVASNNNMIRIYDLRNSAKIIQFYTPHQDTINCVEFHPSSNYLLSCSSDCTSKIIDVTEGRILYTLKGHNKPIYAATFNNDGSNFITAGQDIGIRLWQSNLIENLVRNSEFETSDLESSYFERDSEQIIKIEDDLDNNFSDQSDFDTIIEDKTNLLEEDANEKIMQNNLDLPDDVSLILEKVVSKLALLAKSVSSLESRITKIEKLLD